MEAVDNIVKIEPSLAGLRAARDEAKKNLELIRDDVNERGKALQEQIDALQAEWEKANADLLAVYQRATDIANRAESDLQAAVLEMYVATGNKQVDKALKLSVRVTRKISIKDGPAAVAWAKVNAPMLVREAVDEKSFAKIVETLPEMPDFVDVKETPIAVIGEL